MEVRARPLSFKLHLNLSIILKLASTDPILRYIEEACLYRVSTQWPPTNSGVLLRINYRLSFACLQLTEICLAVLQHHRAHPHLVPHPAVVCASECMCMSECEVKCIFVTFPRLSLILPWWSKSVKEFLLDQRYHSVRSPEKQNKLPQQTE